MQIKRFSVGMICTNCYLIWDEKTKEAAVIDPGFISTPLSDYIKENGLALKYIILTHGHFDHVSGANSLKERYGGKLVACEKEREFLNDYSCTMLNIYGDDKNPPKVDSYVKEGDVLALGETSLSVIETPGHTIGGMSILCEDVLFCGDTLFFEGVGRCDLKTGSMSTLVKSIKEKLFILDDNTRVLCGHGDETTIGYEKTHNPYVCYES